MSDAPLPLPKLISSCKTTTIKDLRRLVTMIDVAEDFTVGGQYNFKKIGSKMEPCRDYNFNAVIMPA